MKERKGGWEEKRGNEREGSDPPQLSVPYIFL